MSLGGRLFNDLVISKSAISCDKSAYLFGEVFGLIFFSSILGKRLELDRCHLEDVLGNEGPVTDFVII